MKKIIFFFFFILKVNTAFSYKIESKDFLVGGGLGANVNVVRYDKASKETPKAQMPLLINFDYAIDPLLGIYGSLIPKFGADSIALSLESGAKYWWSFDAPYMPYLALGLTLSSVFPTNSYVNHYNIGLGSNLGLDFFILGNFLLGLGIKFNPSIAFVGHENKFEFSTLGFVLVTFRI